MSSATPLHPMVVHLPIALAVLMPLLAGLALLAWWRGWLPGRRLWVGVLLLQTLLASGALAALRTGEAEEERVERLVGEAVLERHEDAAETFLAAAIAVLALTGLALILPRDAIRRSVALLAVLGMGVVTALAFAVGSAGGELVYRHGAAAAYAVEGGAAAALPMNAKSPAYRDSNERERD